MSRAITKTKRTVDQDIFCYEWAKDRNGARAAIAAGYSEKTAASQASRLLKNVNIQKKIRKILDKVFYTDQVEIEQIVNKLLIMANYDPAEMYDKQGNLKNIHDIPEKIRRIMTSIKSNRTEISEAVFTTIDEIKTPDRLKAVELLGRYLKMFVDQVEHKGSVNLIIRLASQAQKEDGGNNKPDEDDGNTRLLP